MSVTKNPASPKVCCFCNLAEDNELKYGKFYEHDGIATHYYCLLLSSNMEQNGEDHEGILGFLIEDIHREIRRGKRLVCSYCKKVGATLGCCNVRCKRMFHFPCGLQTGSLHQFFGQFKSFCVNHRPKQPVDSHVLKKISSISNLVCYICYDIVNPTDHVGTLWAPCCKKDAWFHRKCVQQLAISAGYFFKCPLCNNKKDFEKVMQEYGIFIPSQDASWELMPNAFEELLYRHDQCDAAVCQCPKGRKYTSRNAKWELVLCHICGSQGVHMACGQLKWADRIWECVECTSILSKSKNNETIKSSNSEGSSLKEFDLDSDSDTDISVGTEFAMSYTSPNLSPSSSFSSLSDIAPEIKLRPGPRSFKLQQIKAQQINKRTSELTCFDLEGNKTEPINVKDVDDLLLNDTVRKNCLINKESIPEQRNEENNMQKNDKQNDSWGERKLLDSKVNDEESIQKMIDVILIESDDNDNDNDAKILLSKQVTLRAPLQQSSLHKSAGATYNSVSSKDSNTKLTNLMEIDNICQQNPPNVLKSEIASKNASAILEESDFAWSRESSNQMMPNLSLKSKNTVTDIDEGSMNFKISNITSLSPEVYESTSDITYKDKNSANNSVSVLKEKVFKEFMSTLPMKRGMQEENNITFNNYKKIKKNNFDESYKKNAMKSCVAVTLDTSTRQNREMLPIKFDKIHEDSSKRMSVPADEIFNFPLSQNKKPPNQSTSFKMCEISDSSLNGSQENYPFLSVNEMNKTYTNQVKSQNSKEDSNIQSSKDNLMKKTTNTHLCTNSQLPLINNIGPILDLNCTNNQDIRNNKTNIVRVTPSSATVPQTINNTTINNIQTKFTNRHSLRTIDPTACADNKTEMSDKHKIIVSAKETLIAKSRSSRESQNKRFCGDAGTSCAETKSTGRRKRSLSSEYSGNVHTNDIVDSQSLATTGSVFLQVTNNRNTCHQPRLTPQYMNLNDLKFHVCGSDKIQMILYDTFSVNISVKNSEENKQKLASLTSSKKCTSISRTWDEASSSIDYIAEQSNIDKCYHLLKNDSHLINDKAKYITPNRDEAKENLDPIKSKALSCNNTFNDSNLMNDTGNNDTMTSNGYVKNDNETQLSNVSNNINTFNGRICNTSIDNIADNVQFVQNDQTSKINSEDVHQISVNNISECREKQTSDDRLFCKETDKIESSTDLNIININKSVKKVLQNNTCFVNKQVDDNREIGHNCNDYSVLRNDKHLNSMYVTRLKARNQSVTHAANITYNDILNKQIDTHKSDKVGQYQRFHKNTKKHNTEKNTKHNVESFKISIDLCKIQNLINTKPELFINQ